MLKSLRIQNFKCWRDTGDIRMAPITLFFGCNSSGKSSIGQFLMLLKQTAESSDRRAVLYPGGKGSAVQLGTYRDMVFRHVQDQNIAFSYVWNMPESLRVKNPETEQIFFGDVLAFNAEIGLNEAQSMSVKRFNYTLNNNHGFSVGMTQAGTAKTGGYRVDSDKYHLRRKKGRAWDIPAPVKFYGFPDEVVAYHQNADFTHLLNLEHEKFFNSISYLGPLRMKAERTYLWQGITPETVGFSGENAVAAILASKNRRISLGYRKQAKSFDEIIATSLCKMGLVEKVKVVAISEQRQEYEVKVLTKGGREWVDLPDVGFGISQVLPVLVQCYYAPMGSIILMEQPEIHLHPRAQALLADVMIDVIHSRENGKPRNIQLIIETHSEHFLRRLQRRIAEQSLSDKELAVYFANVDRNPARLEPLQLDLFGNILNWPENFFGDEMEDITAQTKASLQRRMQMEQNHHA